MSGTAMVMALLQSLCTAILTINGIRVGIGVAALAASSIAAPLLTFHRDAIRIPMLSIAVIGADGLRGVGEGRMVSSSTPQNSVVRNLGVPAREKVTGKNRTAR